MESRMPKITSNNVIRRTILGLGIIIIFFFWVGMLTDYSFYDNWISISYSVIVFCISVVVFVMSFTWRGLQRIIISLVCLLSLPFALTSVISHRFHSAEHPVQVAMSPDGTRLVEVYCSFTRAHNDGFDHLEIVLRYKSAPFLQRDLGLYNDYVPSHCKFDGDSLVRWEDNNTIYVTERQAYISVDSIKWEGVLSNPGEIDGNK
jgi:hypothetical protein